MVKTRSESQDVGIGIVSPTNDSGYHVRAICRILDDKYAWALGITSHEVSLLTNLRQILTDGDLKRLVSFFLMPFPLAARG